MQTALVAGGAGFIGSHLCEKLLSLGYQVICLDNLLTSKEKNIDHLKDNPNFSFINHDITKPLEDSLKADFVFHLASPASPNKDSNISYHALPKETMLANTTGTFELLSFAERNSARFLFASTSEVYGDPQVHPQPEDYRGNVSTTGPRSVYDEAKRFGETITAYYARKGVDARIVRIFNTYGPRMMREDKRMIVDFILTCLGNEPLKVFGDGTQTRSLCFVDDTVEGLILFMFKDGLKGEIINIGSEEEHSVLEYANLVKELTNSNSQISFGEFPEDDPRRRRPDTSKAKKLLEWQTKVALEDGIQKTIEYFKNNS